MRIVSAFLSAGFFLPGARDGVVSVLFFLRLCFVLGFTCISMPLHATPVFINELHYDNTGGDSGEAVELAGRSGIDLQGWRLWFYNGSTGQHYATLALRGIFIDSQNGHGVLSFPFAGIQNGSPDGLALVDVTGQVLQFISYEGAFTALGGDAINLLSEDIGILESAQTATGTSLQLTGSGNNYADFQWRSGISSFGAINSLQRFNVQSVQGAVAIVPSWALLALGFLGFVLRAKCRKGFEAC